MIVPTGQCGSIIGKGGFRIKEIREKTGCNVKIANELLPGKSKFLVSLFKHFSASTEKLITLYGEPRVIQQCVGSICQVKRNIFLSAFIVFVRL
jgi:polyribonucleotide nucleotidyltransferase